MKSISQSVGISNGVTMLPNNQRDLDTITDLLDGVSAASGGTSAITGNWSLERTFLIVEVTAAILAFQVVNNLGAGDGAVDPNGRTLKLLNRLAGDTRITARLEREDSNSQAWVVAEPTSVNGTSPLSPRKISPTLIRKLVHVRGT